MASDWVRVKKVIVIALITGGIGLGGAALNRFVMASNQGRMPVEVGMLEAVAERTQGVFIGDKWVVMTSATRYPYLGDIIHFSYGTYSAAFSFGDIMIFVAFIVSLGLLVYNVFGLILLLKRSRDAYLQTFKG